MSNEDVRQTAVSVSAIPNDQAGPGTLKSTVLFAPDGGIDRTIENGSESSPEATPSLLQSALYLRSYGFNVIPVIGKKAFDDWKAFQTKLQSHEQIEAYDWKRATGEAVLLGPTNLHAFDLDNVEKRSIVEDALSLLGLPTNYEWIEQTGNGYQILFISTGDIGKGKEDRKSRDSRCEHIELRWRDCYSLVPPSKHFDKITELPDGKSYKWVNGFPKSKPADIPFDVVLSAYDKLSESRQDAMAREKGTPPEELNPTVEEAIAKFDMRKFLHAQRVPFIEEFDSKRQLRIEYEMGHNSLLYWDEQKCSNWMREGKGSGLIDTISLIVYGKYDLNVLEALDKKNVFEILSHFSGVKIEDPKPKIRKRHNTGELIWTDGDELFKEPDEIVECIVKGVLETESFNSIYGEPGAGKSMATLELCLKVVSDKKFRWLGKEIQKRGDVLYIRYEGGRKKFKERFKKMCRALNLSPEEMKRFHSIENPPTLNVLEEEIRSKCELWKPVLIAVDSLYMSHEREENSNTEMRELG